MPWVGIDDLMPEHVKVLPLSDLAFRLHITAICFAARNLTDGHIPHAALPGLGATNKSIGELKRAKLWEQEKGRGWLIHDYLDYNPSRAKVLAQREQKARAGRAGGQATATATAQARALAPATPSGRAPQPQPQPQPQPLRRSKEEAKSQEDTSSPPTPAADDATTVMKPSDNSSRVILRVFAEQLLVRWIEAYTDYVGASGLVSKHGVLPVLEALAGMRQIVWVGRRKQWVWKKEVKSPSGYLRWAVEEIVGRE